MLLIIISLSVIEMDCDKKNFKVLCHIEFHSQMMNWVSYPNDIPFYTYYVNTYVNFPDFMLSS